MEAFDSEVLADRLDRMIRSDELAARRRVDAVEARMRDGRRADPQVYLRRAALPDDGDELAHRRAADDRVVDDDDPPALEHAADRVELDAHVPVPHRLPRLDEGASDVMVADEAELERQLRSFRVPEGDRVARIGHRDHDVRRHRRFLGEAPPELAADLVDVLPEDAAVGTREIDELEDAPVELRGGFAPAHEPRAALAEDAELARRHLALVHRADEVEGAALGGDDVRVVEAAEAERPEAVRIARRDHPVLREKHEREGAAHLRKRLHDHLLDRAGAAAGDEMEDDLAVGGAPEDRPVELHLATQLDRVHEVAVVRDGDLADLAVDEHRLDVRRAREARRRVAVMPDAHAPPEPLERLLVVHLRDETEVAVLVDTLAVGGDDARAFLSAVLERVEAEVRHLGGVIGPLASEYRAFFLELHGASRPFRRRGPPGDDGRPAAAPPFTAVSFR